MSLRIFNSQTKKKEEFLPLHEGKVGIYVCGITAYDVCHVGHARSAVVFDVITRYLRYRGYDVTYVKNFTDVDDKIIEKAQREKKGIAEISERYIREHDEDMEALGVARPTVTPRATEHIDGMIRLVATLIEKGLAYAVDGDVYYAVEQFPGYGKLSGRDLSDMLAGARVDVNDKKRNPYDFSLWKASKEGEPWWESPWGNGRPGWHLECSVMSQRYLGDTFDIHGGGEDLVFPHHENEIAQSEGATGKPLARYWVHNGFVRVNSEKMSKSLGNFFTIRDILKQYHPEVLRLFMLQSHYRSPVDFSDAALNEARQGMDRFYSTLKMIHDLLAAGTERADSAGEPTGKDRELIEPTPELAGAVHRGDGRRFQHGPGDRLPVRYDPSHQHCAFREESGSVAGSARTDGENPPRNRRRPGAFHRGTRPLSASRPGTGGGEARYGDCGDRGLDCRSAVRKRGKGVAEGR